MSRNFELGCKFHSVHRRSRLTPVHGKALFSYREERGSSSFGFAAGKRRVSFGSWKRCNIYEVTSALDLTGFIGYPNIRLTDRCQIVRLASRRTDNTVTANRICVIVTLIMAINGLNRSLVERNLTI